MVRKVTKNYPLLTKEEEGFVERNKDLIHHVVSCYDRLTHSGAAYDNSTLNHVWKTLEQAVGKTLINKLVCRSFWDSCAEASEIVDTWPDWKKR